LGYIKYPPACEKGAEENILSERAEVSRELSKLHVKKLHNLCFSENIVIPSK
jgi:hypothetical protein